MTVSLILDCNIGQWSSMGCGSILYLIKLELLKSAEHLFIYIFSPKKLGSSD